MPTPDFKQILDGLPEKPPRSRLEPYRELILEMRRRGRTLREIVQVLGEKCGVCVVPSTVHDFVKMAQSTERTSGAEAINNSPERGAVSRRNRNRESGNADIDRRIAALKAKQTPPTPVHGRFRYVPGEPLRLTSKTPQ